MRRDFILSASALILLAVGLGIGLYQAPENDKTTLVQTIQENLTREVDHAKEEAFRFDKRETFGFSYYHFLGVGNSMVRWSSNQVVPDPSMFTGRGIEWLHIPRGDFVSITSRSGDSIRATLIPLAERFRITNRYLHDNWNTRVFGNEEVVLLSPTNKDECIKIGGQKLFAIERSASGTSKYGTGSLWLLMAGFALGILALVSWMFRFINKREFEKAWLLWLLGGGALRWLALLIGFPRLWVKSEIFDPTTFASSSLNPSAGDLFLNASYVGVLCFLLYRFAWRSRVMHWMVRHRTAVSGAFMITAALLTFFGLLYPYLFFETISHNSAITLDLTQSLELQPARLVTLLAVCIGLVSSFFFCHISLRVMASSAAKGSRFFWVLCVAVATAMFGAYALALDRDYSLVLAIGIMLILSTNAGRWARNLSGISYAGFAYVLGVVMLLAIQSALEVRMLERERSQKALQRFGADFLVDRDELGEFLLNEASARIQVDPFIQSRLYNPLLGTSGVRQKIRVFHLHSYFDRYEIQIHLFGASGGALDQQTSPDFASFILQYQQGAGQTSYRGIYFVDRLPLEATKGYVTVVPIQRSGRTSAYIAIVLSLKKVVPQSVYPQLLVDNRFVQEIQPDQLNFRIFQGDSVIASAGDWPASTGFPSASDNGWSGGRLSVEVSGDGGRRAVISTEDYRIEAIAANFSFWVLAGVLLLLTGWALFNAIQRGGFKQLTYAARIQLYVYLAFIVPLIAVSVITMNWTARSAYAELEDAYRRKATVLGTNITPSVEAFSRQEIDPSVFENEFTQACKWADVDASIYSPMGKLMVTSQPLIFDNQVLSKWMNPEALQMLQASSSQTMQAERAGDLEFNNAYVALRASDSGRLLGFLGVPFFDSAKSVEQARIGIFSKVLIVFVIILLLFTALSFWATRWLTFPLLMITRSLSRTTLNAENRQLDWNSDDEIGLMVKEYNKMVQNLERSKQELARSQKESAWREMAQRVAHEIKNPLTPMKLTLQQMEMHLKTGDVSRERIGKALEMLLAQLEILNEIASSFSSFAKMPTPLLHPVDLHAELSKVVGLYGGHPQGTVRMDGEWRPVFIMGDEQLIGRVFSNLILNGLQSGGSRTVAVVLSMKQADKAVVVTVTDNGEGMDEDAQRNLFTPHFTTKKWGSGLGLPIVKQGVEQMGGTIQVSTRTGEGTSFLVELPISS